MLKKWEKWEKKSLFYNRRESLDDADTCFKFIKIFHLLGANSCLNINILLEAVERKYSMKKELLRPSQNPQKHLR